jgi:hypothetical protein
MFAHLAGNEGMSARLLVYFNWRVDDSGGSEQPDNLLEEKPGRNQ